MATTLRRLWKNEYFKTAIMIVVIVAVVFGFWFGFQIALGTPYPALAVASGSMCMTQHMSCDGWSHPFDRTLHVGDLIIIQGIDPKTIKVGPDPVGDIIVFHRLSDGELIVHRAIAERTVGNETYFTTKGDANYSQDPDETPQENVVGKVVMRIPWIGHLSLFMRDSSAIYVIMAIIIVLVVLEFIIPVLRPKEPTVEANANVD